MSLQVAPFVTDDGSMAKHYLSKTQIKDKLGITLGALNTLQLPAPDVIVGEVGGRPTFGWAEKTIDEWNESRPGRGGTWADVPAKKRK